MWQDLANRKYVIDVDFYCRISKIEVFKNYFF